MSLAISKLIFSGLLRRRKKLAAPRNDGIIQNELPLRGHISGRSHPKIKNIFLVLALLFNTHAFAIDASTYAFTSTDQAERFNTLIQETRCIVCQNQSLADSSAPLANDLRDKIYRMVISNQSDEQITNYLVKRYGEFILLRPRWNSTTLLLWFFPIAGLLIIGCVFYRMIAKR